MSADKKETIALIKEGVEDVFKGQIRVSINSFFSESLISNNIDEQVKKFVVAINILNKNKNILNDIIDKSFSE